MVLWFPFCCLPGECTDCDPDPGDTVAITLSGWLDDFCGCGWLNSTFILQCAALSVCWWRY